MSSKYRIKEYDNGYKRRYCIQKKSIFGFWYNPDNSGADGPLGWYHNLDNAKEEVMRKLRTATTKKRIVWRSE